MADNDVLVPSEISGTVFPVMALDGSMDQKPARTDTERLDWLERDPRNLLIHRFEDWTYGFFARSRADQPWPEPGREPWLPNMRAAIDAAMATDSQHAA